MAELDSLEIKLKSNAKDVAKDFDTLSNSIGNTSKKLSGINADNFDKLAKSVKNLSKIGNDTKSLDDNLKRVSESLNAFVNNINQLDTSKLDVLADKMDKIASVSKKKLSEATQAVQKMDTSFANTDGIKKSQQTVEEFMASIKGIGKNQQFFGTSSQLDKEIESTQNKIEKIRVSLEAYNQEGKSVETKGWRTAQRQLEQYSNYLDNLLAKQKSMQGNPLGFQFDEKAIANSTDNIYKLMLSDEEYAKMRDSILAKRMEPIEIPVAIKTEQIEEDLNSKLSNLGASYLSVDTSGIDNFKDKIVETEQKVSEMYDKVRSNLVFEPTQLQDNQRYSDTYINLEKQIRQAEQQLEKFLNTQERLEETGVKQTSQRYKNVEIQIRDADAQLQRLNEDMRNLQASGGDVVNVSQFENLSNTLSGVQGASQNLSKALRGIGARGAASGVQSISANIGSLSTGLAGATTAAEGTSTALIGLQTAIPVIGLILAAVTLLVKAFTSLAKAVINAFKKIGNAIKTVIVHVKNLVSNILSIGTSSYQAKTAVGKFINKIIGLFKSRVLRQAITQAMQYIKDGFKELDDYSASIGTPFHNNIAMLVADLKYLGRSIAAAFEPIVNIAAPILDFLIDKIVTVINYINQFFSALSGSSTWTKAVYRASDYGDAVSGASQAQKDLNKSIREWDKLNVITNPNKDSGGSGGGASSGSSGGFETVDVENSVKSLAQRIKESWEKDADFTWLGNDIGQKVKDTLDKIPWDDKIKPAAEKFGKAFATTINGFVEVPGLADTIGKTIAEAINTALTTFDSFTKNIHGDSIGTFIGELVKSALKNIEWDKWITGMGNLGRELAKGINALADTDVLSEISKSFAKLLKGAIEGAYQFVTNLDFKNLGKKIGTAISDFFKEMNEVDESGMTGWQKAGTTVSDFAKGVMDMISEALDSINWDEVGKSVIDFFTSIDWVGFFGSARKLKDSISEALFNLLQIAIMSIGILEIKIAFDFLSKIQEEWKLAKQWLVDKVLEFTTKIPTWEEVKSKFEAIVTNAKDALKAAFSLSFPSWNDIKTTVTNLAGNIKDNFSKKFGLSFPSWSDIKTAVTNLAGNIKDNFSKKFGLSFPSWNDIKTAVTNLAGNIKDNFSKKFGLSFPSWNDIKTTVTNLVGKIKDALKATLKLKLPHLSITITKQNNNTLSGKAWNSTFGGKPSFSVTYYAQGGFPEDGWFRASHGEYFGKFDNGQSVIANNKQIENGLMNTVRAGNSEVAMLMAQELEQTKQQNELLRQLLVKESGISYKDVFKATQKGASEYQKMTGSPAFI